MVFSSVPPYLDHHNWHHQLHQSNHHGSGGVGGVIENPNIPSSQTPPPEQQPGGGGGGGGGEGSIRPGSMVDRARLAKLPLPEPGLNCPRCDSTNTKFCYFNNYNLTQPRHFCKMCRRYWTRGGALRNVPVGGGCRRNKRNSKSRSSKSPSQSGTKSLNVSPPRSSSENMTSTQLSLPTSLHLPFMTSLSQYGGVAGNNLNSGIVRFPTEIGNFQMGSGNHFQTGGGGENWRLPILPGFEVPNNNNLFSYENHGVIGSQPSTMIGGDLRLKSNSGVHDPQIDLPVKVEDNRGLNLSKQFLGMLGNTGQQPWGGNSWAEFPGISTSTPTSHFL